MIPSLVAGAILLSSSAVQLVHPILSRSDDDPAVRIWLNRNGRYRAGDRAKVQVQTRNDGYLIVLHVDPYNRLRVLFPLEPADDDFVRGGKRIEIVGRDDVEPGTETIVESLGELLALLAALVEVLQISLVLIQFHLVRLLRRFELGQVLIVFDECGIASIFGWSRRGIRGLLGRRWSRRFHIAVGLDGFHRSLWFDGRLSHRLWIEHHANHQVPIFLRSGRLIRALGRV